MKTVEEIKTFIQTNLTSAENLTQHLRSQGRYQDGVESEREAKVLRKLLTEITG